MATDTERELLRIVKALLKEQKITNALMTSMLEGGGAPARAKAVSKPVPPSSGGKNLLRRFAA
jgi:hypothetical protein